MRKPVTFWSHLFRWPELAAAIDWLHHYSCTHHECCPCGGSEDYPEECDCGAIHLRLVLDALKEAQAELARLEADYE